MRIDMTREDDIRKEIGEEKAPPIKNYIAIFFVIAAILGVYFLFTSVLTPGTTTVSPGTVQHINGPADAAGAESAISSNVREANNDIDYVGNVLGT